MVKRRIRRVLRIHILMAACVFGMLFAAYPLQVSASVNDLRIEQVQAEMPELYAYFYLNNGEDPVEEEITASLGSDNLSLMSLRRYDPAIVPCNYFFIVDCNSVTSAQMEAVKAALREFASGMDANTPVTLIAFGTEVQVLLQRETDPEAVYVAIDTLATNQKGTLFFNALAKAIDLASNTLYPLERNIAFVFTDAVDYNIGGYTKTEVDQLLATCNMPFYGLGFDGGSKQDLDDFGVFARASGGDITVVTATDFSQRFQGLLEASKNVWVASFDAGRNLLSAEPQEFKLSLTTQGLSSSISISLKHWKRDEIPPQVTSVEQQSDNSIRIQFSEPVDKATLRESFSVSDESGNLLSIDAIAYKEEDSSVLLSFREAPTTGSYILSCPGVADRSMEKNKVQGTVLFKFIATEPVQDIEQQQETPIAAWIFIAFVGLGIIAGFVVAATRKKQSLYHEQDIAVEPYAENAHKNKLLVEHLPLPDNEIQLYFSQMQEVLPKIKLQVTAPSGISKVLELPINKTLFFGRSDICDVVFDDASMSRQHFVISQENGRYTITDLDSSGGTMINGVRLQNTRSLQTGDTIRAGGQSIIFFELESNQEGL